jgi:hypothetical protein
MRHKWIPSGTYNYTCTNRGCHLEMQKPARYRLVGTTGSFKEGYFPCPTSVAASPDCVLAIREVLIILEKVRKNHTTMSQDAVVVIDAVKAAVEQKLTQYVHDAPASNTDDEDDPI